MTFFISSPIKSVWLPARLTQLPTLFSAPMQSLIISIVSAFLGKQQLYWQWSNQEYNIGGTELTIFGWSMLSIGVLCLIFGVISWFFTISLQSSTRMLREAIAVQVKEKATHIKTKPINKSAAESATKRLKSKAIKS